MAYTIEFAYEVWDELATFRKGEQVKILKAIETHLTYEPMRQSQSRIKRLRPGTQTPVSLTSR